MVVFPNCKINLGLHVCKKRDDGFHDLETIFFPVGLNDALEIIPLHNSTTDIEFSSSGLKVDGDMAGNICVKAYHLLKKDIPGLPAIKMHLHKAIPMGAGLGGGSADGAFALQLLNKKINLNLSTPKLLNYALQLGSDCPFFIINSPCFATSRGEILEPIEIDLKDYQIVLINPGIHINTGWAFSQLTPALPETSIATIIEQPITTWKEALKNDFEKPVFEKYPEIKNIKAHLYNSGAVYAAMSGSGSTVFGIFEKGIPVPQFVNTNYFVRTIS